MRRFLLFAVVPLGCHHVTKLDPGVDAVATHLARDYVVQVDALDPKEAAAVMGCLPDRWRDLDSASTILDAMRMDNEAQQELEGGSYEIMDDGRTAIIRQKPSPNAPCNVDHRGCCLVGYHAATAGDFAKAVGKYGGTCEPVNEMINRGPLSEVFAMNWKGGGYLGCLPLLAIYPHLGDATPEWMPKLSRRRRLRVAAWAIEQARADESNTGNAK